MRIFEFKMFSAVFVGCDRAPFCQRKEERCFVWLFVVRTVVQWYGLQYSRVYISLVEVFESISYDHVSMLTLHK